LKNLNRPCVPPRRRLRPPVATHLEPNNGGRSLSRHTPRQRRRLLILLHKNHRRLRRLLNQQPPRPQLRRPVAIHLEANEGAGSPSQCTTRQGRRLLILPYKNHPRLRRPLNQQPPRRRRPVLLTWQNGRRQNLPQRRKLPERRKSLHQRRNLRPWRRLR